MRCFVDPLRKDMKFGESTCHNPAESEIEKIMAKVKVNCCYATMLHCLGIVVASLYLSCKLVQKVSSIYSTST